MNLIFYNYSLLRGDLVHDRPRVVAKGLHREYLVAIVLKHFVMLNGKYF